MTDQTDAYDISFYQLTFSLHAAAMQHMGKTISPLTGKIERSLEMAKNSIDMLEMLQKKTAGNLTADEKKMLDHFLYDLRMNYIDEVKKGDSPPEPEEADSKGEQTGSGKDEAGPEKDAPPAEEAKE